MSFQALGISEPLLRSVAEYGYREPTEVQRAVIPEVLGARDVWVRANTGAGKTAAFVLPILEMWSQRERVVPRRVHTLILVPTRELAQQTAQAIVAFRRYLPQRPKTVLVLGGVSINPQMMELRGGADIVVATPGRLLDLVDKNALSLASVSQLVLDEADRLARPRLRRRARRASSRCFRSDRQTLLFSATFGAAVGKVAEALLRAPVRIDVAGMPADVPAILQRAIEVDAPRRTQLLRHLIDEHGWERVLVFVATTPRDRARRGEAPGCGDQRARASWRSRPGRAHCARSTCSARRTCTSSSRPTSPRAGSISRGSRRSSTTISRGRRIDYVHRIGRTGRAGESGVAISFVTADMQATLSP